MYIERPEKKTDKEKHGNVVTVRLTDTEFQQLSKVAEKTKLSKGAVIRFYVFKSETKADWLKHLDKDSRKATAVRGVDRETLKNYINDFKKVGTNVNQIAHKANRDNRVPPETKAMLQDTIQKLNKVLGALGCHT